TPQSVSAPHLRDHILSLRLRYTNTKSSTTARVFSMPGGTRSSSRGKGGGEAMTSGVKRATRNSGIAVDVNLWDLRDLPKTSTVKKAPKLKLKDYTVRLPRASRDQDMKQLRRAARDNEGVRESDPVYPLT
ncbi:unnamed protein product, partial [Ectocarpus sp. 12 AP-2014]